MIYALSIQKAKTVRCILGFLALFFHYECLILLFICLFQTISLPCRFTVFHLISLYRLIPLGQIQTFLSHSCALSFMLPTRSKIVALMDLLGASKPSFLSGTGMSICLLLSVAATNYKIYPIAIPFWPQGYRKRPGWRFPARTHGNIPERGGMFWDVAIPEHD